MANTIYAKAVLYSDNTREMSHETLLNNIVNGVIRPVKIHVRVHRYGSCGLPWGEWEDDIGSKELREILGRYPKEQNPSLWQGLYLQFEIQL